MEPLKSGDPVRVGPYQLVRRLGMGGMGQVFLAQSPGGRPVALKMIHSQLAADPGFGQRFAREVEAASRVPAFYTAPVVAADPGGDPPWLATTYVPGPSLQDAMSAYGGPMPVDFVRALAAALAEGLGAIHAAGVVHFDLKPSNVLLASDGPRIIDFGISRAIQGTTQFTSTIMGTPAFMSPEQVYGRQAGPPSDVFSLGSVLTYAATGHPPFFGNTPIALGQQIAHAWPVLDRLPQELRPLIERCLAKDPQQRPTTAQIVATLGPASTWRNWLPEPLVSKLPDYRPPSVLGPPVAPPPAMPGYSQASGQGPITDPPRWGAEVRPGRTTGPPPNRPADSPPAQRPAWRRRPVLTVGGTITVSIAVTIALVLRLSASNNPHVVAPPTSGVTTPLNIPTATPLRSSVSEAPRQPAIRTIRGPWSQQVGPLTLIVIRIDRSANSLKLHMRAVNSASGEIILQVPDNFVATDNTGHTYPVNPFGNWTEDVPPGQFVTGTVTLPQAPPAHATSLTVSFSSVFVYGQPPPGGITITGIPIPK
jgi:serine/threonine protein kinase